MRKTAAAAGEKRLAGGLESFFSPNSIAVVGAAREPGKVGRVVFDNVIADFQGPVFPVNPKASEIQGRKCFATVAEINQHVDLLVIAVPARYVADVIRDGALVGTKAAIVISAGFKETGIAGAALESELVKVAASHGIRILGPNCLGLMDTSSFLNASFAGRLPNHGGIAFMSQSGALCTSILDWARTADMGFSKFVSLGNKADLSEIDLFSMLAEDEATTVIATYLEGITDGRAFMRAAAQASAKKPVIALKSGTTQAGARAVSSHTGSLAGSEAVYNAAFRQSGVIRASSVEDLFDFALGFSMQPLPRGRRLAIVTNAGGPGIMAADAIERHGLSMTDFAAETVDKLQQQLPSQANVYNPVDVLGDALAARYGTAIRAVLADPGVDSAIVLLTPQAMTEVEETAKQLVSYSKQTPQKPVIACFMGGRQIEKGVEVTRQANIPTYHFPERAVAMISAMAKYGEERNRKNGKITHFPVNKERAGQVFDNAGDRRQIVDVEALSILESYGLRVPLARMARTAKDALEIAAEIRYPVALKVASPDILHKTDIGAIKVGVENDFELRRAFREILKNVETYLPEADISGVTVQRMVQGGREIVLGANKDPQFGHVLMFGLGGIYVEVLKDVAFRLAPLTPDDAREMLDETRSAALLRGARGQKNSDIDALIDALTRLSQLVSDWPQIEELDINPLMVMSEGNGVAAVDARILVEAKS